MKQNELMIKEKTVPYTITYSARKSLAIRMTVSGELEVKAPGQMKEREIKWFLLEKKDWIYKQVMRAEERKKQKAPFEWKDGACIPINGRDYYLRVESEQGKKREAVQLINHEIVIKTEDVSKENIRELAVLWFKKACKPLLESRVKHFADNMQAEYHRVVLKEQKTCWGSCSNRKNLNFNWKLLLMPPEIMDYVIVHELSHLWEMNHSPQFWDNVEAVLPDYKKKRKWLKDNESRFGKL